MIFDLTCNPGMAFCRSTLFPGRPFDNGFSVSRGEPPGKITPVDGCCKKDRPHKNTSAGLYSIGSTPAAKGSKKWYGYWDRRTEPAERKIKNLALNVNFDGLVSFNFFPTLGRAIPRSPAWARRVLRDMMLLRRPSDKEGGALVHK
jgi:hypothetical protein